MDSNTDLPVVIIAGGGAKRFGTAKGLAKLGERTLLAHVIERVSRQTTGPICLNAPLDSPYAGHGLQMLPDQAFVDCGPLAGLLTALTFADNIGADEVCTVPVDTPFLPADLLSRLTKSGAPSIAASSGRTHPICGLWPTASRTALEQALNDGARSAMRWVELSGARKVAFEPQSHIDPFFNVNTPSDLKTAERLKDAP